MARGVMPRRPAKSGTHEGVGAKRQSAKALLETKQSRRDPRASKGPMPPTSSRSKGLNKGASKLAKPNAYKPLAPERISDILQRLDQRYPDVTCALTHRD